MKNDIFDRITHFIGKTVVSHPGKITVIVLLLTLLLFIPITYMDTSTSMSDFTPDSRFVRADKVLRAEFNTTDRITGILEAKSGSVLSRKGLSYLEEIESRLRTDESVSRYLVDYGDPVVTIADPILHVMRSISNGSVDLDNASDELLQKALAIVLRDPDYSRLVSSDMKYTVVIIKLRHNLIGRDDESTEVEIINRIKEIHMSEFDYYSFSALNYRMREDAISSLKVLLPISILLVVLILAFGLRSAPRVIASLIGIGSAVIMSFGLFSLTGLLFSQMMFFAPIVIIVLCIDYGIHLLFRDREFLRSGEPPGPSMMKAVRFMGVSIALSTITTALAFGSNGLSTIPAVASFGIFLAMGIVLSFVVMMFLVPSLVLLYDRYLKAGDHADMENGPGKVSSSVRRISRGMVSVYWKVPWIFLVTAIILAGSGLYFGLQTGRDMRAEDVTAGNSPIVRSVHVLNEHFRNLEGETCYVIVMGDIADPSVMDAFNSSVENMKDDRHVGDTNESVISIIPAIKYLFHLTGAPDRDGNGLPDSREILLPILTNLYDNGFGDIPRGEVRSLLSRSDRNGFDGTLAMVSAVNVSGPRGGDLLRELETDVEPLKNRGVVVMYAGFLFERYDMLDQMIRGMTISTVVTTLLVTIIVIILFRSFRYGLITALPVILVIGWIMGVMAITEYKWNMVTVTITSMTVGVGIDYSIHLVERYRQETTKGGDLRESMASAMATTGGSLFLAASTTFAGFFVMSFSSIGMYNMFGVLASLMIVFSFIAAVIVLPPVILWVERILRRRKNR